MDLLAHATLLKNKGTTPITAEEALDNVEIICYYFSAHWCPPCRMFTPILADFYSVCIIISMLECNYHFLKQTGVERC